MGDNCGLQALKSVVTARPPGTSPYCIASAEHPPVDAEVVQCSHDVSRLITRVLDVHADKDTGTFRCVLVDLSSRNRITEWRTRESGWFPAAEMVGGGRSHTEQPLQPDRGS